MTIKKSNIPPRKKSSTRKKSDQENPLANNQGKSSTRKKSDQENPLVDDQENRLVDDQGKSSTRKKSDQGKMMLKPKSKLSPKPRVAKKAGRQGEGGGVKARVLTEKEIKNVEKLAAILSQAQIADFLGISHTNYQLIQKRQPEVADAYKRGRAIQIEGMGKTLVKQAHEGNVAASIFYLKTQAGWREAAPELPPQEPIVINIVQPTPNA